jgi:hypothetical protein
VSTGRGVFSARALLLWIWAPPSWPAGLAVTVGAFLIG